MAREQLQQPLTETELPVHMETGLGTWHSQLLSWAGAGREGGRGWFEMCWTESSAQTWSHRWVLDASVGAAPFPGCLQGSEQGLLQSWQPNLSVSNSHPLRALAPALCISDTSGFKLFFTVWKLFLLLK